ncbi:MAG: sulfatase-like hydrolase/transferase, partial [Bacteroidales bacterium]|nr:sulfatase-like hydrolase/transferase [Bacteroidales bacterium]
GISALTGTGCKEKSLPPNVVFILADDQRADALGCSGNSYINTPNIDGLAGTGFRFSNAFIMGGHHGAISAPSRAMLLSGKYLFNVYDKLDDVITMPMHFEASGYITFGTGKWHNGAKAFETSFQRGKAVFLGGMSDHFRVPCRDMSHEGRLSDPVVKGFSTDLFADAAIDFLNGYAANEREKPFFCYIAFTAPHDPYSPDTGYIDCYPDQTLPLPGNFMPLHPFQFDNLTVRDENLLTWPRPPEMVRSALSDYYALIEHLDKRVGDVITTLRQNDLYDNTIIVYAADNGLAIGSHGLLGKQNLYEHSMKVPLIIRGPGIPEGKVSESLVYLLDLFPTLSELCSLSPPVNIDGKSLLPLLNGFADQVRTSLFTAYRNTVRAVRNDEWKLIIYPQRSHCQLFNLKKDPLELNNLATEPAHRHILEEMEVLLREWQIVTNDTISLTTARELPLNYDHEKLKRKPDIHQPEYTLKKYFGR